MKNLALQNIKILILAVIISLSATYAYAQWSNPTAAPPGNNTPTPINVSSTGQTKAGALGADVFVTSGGKGWLDWTYGGGWYMNDTSWIRAYNNKGIATGGQMVAGEITSWTDVIAGRNMSVGQTIWSKYIVANDSITLGGVSRNTWPTYNTYIAIGAEGGCGGGWDCTDSVAYCPAGYRVVGGGHDMVRLYECGNDRNHPTLTSKPMGNGWVARVACSNFRAVALCVQ